MFYIEHLKRVEAKLKDPELLLLAQQVRAAGRCKE